MNENLAQMVKDSTVVEPSMLFSETDLDLPQVESQTQQVPEPQPDPVAPTANNIIPLTILSKWFEANHQNFNNIKQVKVSIRGVDPQKTLIVTVGESEKEGDETEKRNVKLFENPDTTPVLDLPGLEMNPYNNGFRIIHRASESILIKAYGIKTGLICVSCINVEGKLIPYNVSRIKKNATTFELVPHDSVDRISQRLLAQADLESVQLLYRQISKAGNDLKTNQEVISWLLDRQSTVTDINHHLQIDNVIIAMLK